MARLRGPGALKQVPLLAMYTDRDVVFDEQGNKKGVWMDVQVDQSQLTKDDIRSGKGDPNPHLNSHCLTNEEGNSVISHRTFYTARQFDKMCGDAGKKAIVTDSHYSAEVDWQTALMTMSSDPQTVQMGYMAVANGAKRHAVPLIANVAFVKQRDEFGKESDYKQAIVLLPKDHKQHETPEESAKIDAYNARNQVSVRKVMPTVFAKQDAVTQDAREARDERAQRERTVWRNPEFESSAEMSDECSL